MGVIGAFRKFSSRLFLFALLPTMGLFGAGCGSFHHQWRQALASPEPAEGIAGPWQGQWRSDDNGHSGRLRSLITRNADGSYKARFQAKYFKILSFGYTLPLQVTAVSNQVHFEGAADLGHLGGVYHCQGNAEATNFVATYSSKYDHGTFQMSRP